MTASRLINESSATPKKTGLGQVDAVIAVTGPILNDYFSCRRHDLFLWIRAPGAGGLDSSRQ